MSDLYEPPGAYWKARAEKAETENVRLREVLQRLELQITRNIPSDDPRAAPEEWQVVVPLPKSKEFWDAVFDARRILLRQD